MYNCCNNSLQSLSYLFCLGDGHFSPIGGYHKDRDLILVLDTARFKYPPHWVPLELIWKAMLATDQSTGMDVNDFYA